MNFAAPFIIAISLIVSSVAYAESSCRQDVRKINGYNVTLANNCQVNANGISCGKIRPGSKLDKVSSIVISGTSCYMGMRN